MNKPEMKPFLGVDIQVETWNILTSHRIPSKAGFSILRLWKTEHSYQPPRSSKDICFQIPVNRLKKIPIKKKNGDLNK